MQTRWKLTHTEPVRPGELSSVVVCAPDEEAALDAVCGGPSDDYPGVSFFSNGPLPGFPADRSRVKIREVT
jgi:hypothetical protein